MSLMVQILDPELDLISGKSPTGKPIKVISLTEPSTGIQVHFAFSSQEKYEQQVKKLAIRAT